MKQLAFLMLLIAGPVNALAQAIKDDLHCLALNIYHEARGEPHEGQLAVAYVTMNRMVSHRYPNSVCGVVWQRKQFSWTHDGRSDRPRDKRAWRRSQRIASYIYNNYFRFMQITKGAMDVTRGALYYYAPRLANPKWAKFKVATAQIGAHLFLKDS